MHYVNKYSFFTFVFMILSSLSSNAKTYKGEITIEVGQTRTVDVGYGSSGHWSKSNSTFVFVGQGQTSCEIKGNQVGTGTLEYFGVVGASDFELYWTVNVVPFSLPQLSANPPGGEIEKGTTVMLYANGKGAEWSYDGIYYTLDGSDPKAIAKSEQYTYKGIVMEESCTLRAVGRKYNSTTSNFEFSNELTETYTVKLPELTLNASPYNIMPEPVDAGTKMYLSTPYVTGTEIFYTLDGTEPSKNSIKYTSSGITINDFCIVKAIAYKDGYEPSRIRTWRYGINQQDISIDATNFPDEKFRNYLLGLDVGKDGVITAKEIINTDFRSPVSKGISDLKGIEFFELLTDLSCNQNSLSSIDLKKNRYLEYLQCFMNKLSTIDLSENIILKSLICNWNSLTSLDISKNTALTYLDCYHNQLSSLDVSKNVALKTLNCSSNQLTSLDVNTSLEELDCSHNQLTTLDLSNNTALKLLNCSANQIKGKAMDNLISSLPMNTTNDKYELRILNTRSNDGNVCTKTQVAAAKAKGWIPTYCYRVDDDYHAIWEEYEGSGDKPESISLLETATVTAGLTITLTPEVTPSNAEYTLTWSSDDETVATVSQDGMVTGVKKGKTFINVETDNGKTAYCKLTVTAAEPVSIELPKTATVYVGGTLTLTPTITPEGAETTLTWTSDDESVARISANGVLTGVAEGLALVTVSTSNGLTSNACKVKVEPDPSGISTVMMDEKTGVPIYTPSGQRLSAPRKGINIVGGKKVIVR